MAIRGVLLGIVGCAGGDDAAGDASPAAETGPTGATDTAAPPTGHTGTSTDTGTGPVLPGPAVPVTVERFEACTGTTWTYPYVPQLEATSTGAGEVQVRFAGLLFGCTCEGGSLSAWTEGAADLTVDPDAGDCDGSLCCEFDATLSEVPAGTWTVTVPEGYRPSVSVTVP